MNVGNVNSRRKEHKMNIRKDYDMKVIGGNLRKLRIENGYSIEEIREFLCLGSVQAVYKYELGSSYPPGDTLLALMEIYHADVYDIIRTDEEDDKSSSCFIGTFLTVG